MFDILLLLVQILPACGFLTSFALLVWITTSDGMGRDIRAFGWIMFMIMGWQFTDFVLGIKDLKEFHLVVLRSGPIFYMGAALLFLNFAYELAHRRRGLVFIGVQVVGWATAFSGLLSNLLIKGVIPSSWGVFYVPGPAHLPALILGAILPIALGCLQLFRALQKSVEPISARRFRGVLWAVCLALVLSFANNIVLPQWLLIPLPMLGSTLVAVFSVLTFMALVRNRDLCISIKDVADNLFVRSGEGVLLIDHLRRILQSNPRAVSILGTKAHAGNFIHDCFRFPQYEFEEEFSNRNYTVMEGNNSGTLLLTQEKIKSQGIVRGTLLFVEDTTRKSVTTREPSITDENNWIGSFLESLGKTINGKHLDAQGLVWAKRWMKLCTEPLPTVSKPFVLNAILGNLCRKYGPELAKKRMEWRLEFNEEIPDNLVGDAGILEEILDNLLRIALHRTDLGWVVLSVRLRERTRFRVELTFSVSDTGLAGLMPALEGGVLRKLCNQMGGELGEENLEGYGNTIWCRIPFGMQEVAMKAGELPRILLVESKQLPLGLFLSSEEFRLVTVNNCQDIFRALGHAVFQLVIIDLDMPQSGEFIAEIRQYLGGRWIPIIGVSEQNLEGASIKGADLCIARGMQEMQYLETIYGFMGKSMPNHLKMT